MPCIQKSKWGFAQIKNIFVLSEEAYYFNKEANICYQCNTIIYQSEWFLLRNPIETCALYNKVNGIEYIFLIHYT